MNFLLALPVLLPLLAAALTLGLGRHYRIQSAVAFVTLSLALIFALAILGLTDKATLVLDVGSWAAPIGISLVADRLAAIMLCTSLVVMVAVLAYSLSEGTVHESPDIPTPIFHPTYLVLCAGVNNAFLTGDMFNLYVGVEILLTSSFVLITLGGTRDRIRSGTVYVAVSMVGSAIFLVALASLYGACGTMNMAQLSMRLTEIDPAVAMLIQTLFLVAFGLKAAVFPLSAWLPDSYPTAPAPITAVFAGLLTKVGVYAIIRMQVLIFPTSPVDVVLAVVGIFTMIVGILGAVAQDDIKRLLSFTLVSHIGFMIWGISLANTLGIASAVFYAVHHILVQTTLFLVAGMMEKIGGSTSLRRLHSLAKISPLLAIWYLIPAFNLVGFPPLTGFLGKLGLAEATAARNTPLAWALLAAGLVASLLTLYVVVKIWLQTFWQGRESAQESGGEEEEAVDTLNPAARIPRGVWAATGFLTAVTIGLSVFAGPVYTFTERATISLTRAEYQRAVLGEDGRGHGISKLSSGNWGDFLNEDGNQADTAAAETTTKSVLFDVLSLSPRKSYGSVPARGGSND